MTAFKSHASSGEVREVCAARPALSETLMRVIAIDSRRPFARV